MWWQRLSEQYDVITTFDVLHDMVNPRGALKAIHQALKPDGSYLLLEINSSDKLEENVGPLGALLYSVSVLYCMTTSLANSGEGLGTCGLPPSKVKELCEEAGFRNVRQLPLEKSVQYLVRGQAVAAFVVVQGVEAGRADSPNHYRSREPGQRIRGSAVSMYVPDTILSGHPWGSRGAGEGLQDGVSAEQPLRTTTPGPHLGQIGRERRVRFSLGCWTAK